ncbi:hypothetical protein D932_00787 [Enterococcus casseliflavus 14-MB-W-14]|nr:hypothetical protein D932_00787 [Enterococcus casseliflavus 14-MB-W-14]
MKVLFFYISILKKSYFIFTNSLGIKRQVSMVSLTFFTELKFY